MLVYIVIFSLLVLVLVMGTRAVGVSAGKVYYDGDGLLEYKQNTQELIRYVKRASKHIRISAGHYTFHFFVRVLYYIKRVFDIFYTKARDRFVKQAVKDKRAVSRFWVDLKKYKQEIDIEKKIEGSKSM